MKRVLHKLTKPVWVPHKHPVTKRVHNIAIGLVFMIIGPTLASLGHDLPTVLRMTTDIIGYFLHGYGSLPIIRVVKEHFDIEECKDC